MRISGIMKTRAWAPAHISAFFSPHIGRDAESTGSTGAGLCLEGGVVAELDVEYGEGKKSFRINGEERDLPVTATAVSILEKKSGKSIHGSFDIKTDYPGSQGFGMSAAGTLAVSIALSHLLNLPEKEGEIAAHRAELMNRTGLGDVVAETEGGAVLRKKPGLPPAGETMSFRIINGGVDAGVIVAVIGEKIPTNSVLSNSTMMRKIVSAGEGAVKELQAHMYKKGNGPYVSARDFSSISRIFAAETGLITPEIRRALEVLDAAGLGERYPFSMVMLGNAIFFLPPSNRKEAALADIKEALFPIYPSALYYVDDISKKGAHFLD